MKRLTPGEALIQWHNAIRNHPITKLIDEICDASKQNKARANAPGATAEGHGRGTPDSVHGDDFSPP